MDIPMVMGQAGYIIGIVCGYLIWGQRQLAKEHMCYGSGETELTDEEICQHRREHKLEEQKANTKRLYQLSNSMKHETW